MTVDYTIAVSALITAPPSACYAAIADYRVAHPQIVPPKYFGPIVVLAGGVRAGTRATCSLRLMGKTYPFTFEVTEPVPGRVLVETNAGAAGVSTFTVVGEGASSARVTIETRFPGRRGLRGVLERLVTRRVFPGIYAEELRRLANYVGGAVVSSKTATAGG